MALFKRNKVWWMRFSHNGKQIRRSTETTNKKMAEKIHAKVLTQISEGKWFERSLGDGKTLHDMLEKYLEEYSISKTVSGQSRDKVSAEHFKTFFGNPLIRDIRPSMIVDYKAWRRKAGKKPATIERELCLLKRSFNLAVKEWEWIKENPVLKVSRERFNNQIDRWLTVKEETKLLKECPDWVRDIVVFALNTGMRQGEILDLEWRYVDLKRKSLTVMKTKNGERRTIPVNQATLEVLNSKAKVRYLNSDYVFPSKVGTRIGKRSIARAFSQAVKKAGIEDFRFHDMRHSFATRLVQNGIKIYTVAKLLGHKDIRMTQRYAHHSTESLRGGVEILDKISTTVAQWEDVAEGTSG